MDNETGFLFKVDYFYGCVLCLNGFAVVMTRKFYIMNQCQSMMLQDHLLLCTDNKISSYLIVFYLILTPMF